MRFTIKLLMGLIYLSLLTWVGWGWFDTFVLGRYWEGAPPHMIILFGLAWPIAALGLFGALLWKTITYKWEDEQ
jgi:hypothetical protein